MTPSRPARSRRALAWAGTFVVALTLATARPGPAAPAEPYPMSVVVAEHVGLFHWVDSIAGTSGGKTVPIYRKEFAQRFHTLSEADQEALRRFRRARMAHAEGIAPEESAGGAPSPGGGGTKVPGYGYPAMLGVFLEADSLDTALASVTPQLPPERAADLRQSLGVFAGRYAELWDESKWVNGFARQVQDPAFMQRIQTLLAQLAAFFGVSPTAPPRPRLVLVPVPGGGGTHAQAVGVDLLLEIRPGDRPADQASVIAHENSHFLFHRVPADRFDRLEHAARLAGPRGAEIWAILQEALPTALGQGVAASRFDPGNFSMQEDWYHIPAVDRVAKRIYPVVDRALAHGAVLDEQLVSTMVRAAGSP